MLFRSAAQRRAGSGGGREATPAEERGRRGGPERLSEKGWRGKSALAAGFAKEASAAFAELEKSALEGAKKIALKKVGKHLERLAERAKDDGHGGGGEDWSAKSWWDRMEVFMKPERSAALEQQGREASERSAEAQRMRGL